MQDDEFTLVPYRGKLAIQYHDESGRHRVSTGTSDDSQAKRFLRAWVERYQEARRPDRITVKFAWEGYRKSIVGKAAYKTMGFEWKPLASHFGELWADDIKERDCASYAAERIAAGRSAGTAWTELGRLRTALKWAEKQGLIAKAPHIWRPTPPGPRQKRMTPEQVKAVIDATMTPHARLALILLWTTGARIGAVLSLTWDRVDFEGRLIHFAEADVATNNKGRGVVRMNNTARSALLGAKAGALTGYVIEWDAKPVESIKTALRAAARRAGLPWVTAHVFRHSVACNLVEQGVPMEKVSQLLAHRNIETTERIYARFSPAYQQEAAAAQEIDFFGSIEPKRLRKVNPKRIRK